LLLSIVTLCAFVSCTGKANTVVTVESIVNKFSEKQYHVQNYNAEEIAFVAGNFSAANLELNGEISTVVHIIDSNLSTPQFEFVYVYEFTDKTDAEAFAENRMAYVETLDGGNCVLFGSIVIFGNSPLIAEIGK